MVNLIPSDISLIPFLRLPSVLRFQAKMHTTSRLWRDLTGDMHGKYRIPKRYPLFPMQPYQRAIEQRYSITSHKSVKFGTLWVMRKEKLIVAALIAIGVLLSLSQTIVYYLKTPPGTYYPFVHNYIEDYYYYLHLMRQGWEGQWLATSWMTPEKFPAQFVNIWFIFLGHVARLFHLSLPFTYTLARGIGAVALYALSYQLIRLAYPKSVQKRLVALAIVIFGTYFWGWNNGPTVQSLVHQWTSLDPLFRASYIPHHLWSKIFMIATFLLLVRGAKPLLVILFAILMGFSSPVTLITFVPVVTMWCIFEIIAKQKISIVLFLLAIIISLAIAFYHRTLEQGIFPWNSYEAWENSMRYPVTVLSYLQTLGPQFILFVVAIPRLWRMSIGRLLIAWTGTSLLLLFGIGTFIPLSNSRFLDGYQFIPIAVGAVIGIWKFPKKIFIPLLLIYFLLGLIASWNEHRAYIKDNSSNPQVYIPKQYMEAFAFLDNKTPTQSMVLAPQHISTMIPAFTGNRVVWGHPLMTMNSMQKSRDINTFYSARDAQAQERILAEYHVSYILEIGPTDILEKLPLKEIFRNLRVTIFQVL